MSEDFDFEAPDHCTLGVVGEVGHRLFLFYCRQGLVETTVKVEKQQIAVLAGVAYRWLAPSEPAAVPVTGEPGGPRPAMA